MKTLFVMKAAAAAIIGLVLSGTVPGISAPAVSHSSYSTTSTSAASQPVGEKVTIKGVAKAIGNASGQMNPMVPHATLTVAKEGGGGPEVYYVNGWAGVILAKQCDGKEAEVTGVVSEQGGRKTILGRSIDVTMGGIPVEGKPKTGKK